MSDQPREVYVIAIQGSHGADLTTGDCLYFDYKEAEAVLKERHKDGSTYLKIFTLRKGPSLADTQLYEERRQARLAKQAGAA